MKPLPPLPQVPERYCPPGQMAFSHAIVVVVFVACVVTVVVDVVSLSRSLFLQVPDLQMPYVITSNILLKTHLAPSPDSVLSLGQRVQVPLAVVLAPAK